MRSGEGWGRGTELVRGTDQIASAEIWPAAAANCLLRCFSGWCKTVRNTKAWAKKKGREWRGVGGGRGCRRRTTKKNKRKERGGGRRGEKVR